MWWSTALEPMLTWKTICSIKTWRLWTMLTGLATKMSIDPGCSGGVAAAPSLCHLELMVQLLCLLMNSWTTPNVASIQIRICAHSYAIWRHVRHFCTAPHRTACVTSA